MVAKMEKSTAEQLTELQELSKVARANDWSEVLKSKGESETRIRDLKDKGRME